jgi:anti-sigma regulatory factor (Ser/Thr protein kinase)
MPSVATDETARLAALHRYKILDTDPEQAFDDLTLLASQICGTPIALITLVDANRQWFKSRVGVSVTETSRAISFCTHAICQREVLIIPDASTDGRVSESPLVTNEPHIRFYAGAPLVTPEGQALGTLCVADCVSRTLSPEQLEALQALRRQVEGQLELRRNLLDLQNALADRDRAEAAQTALIDQLRTSQEEVQKLSALIPYCSKTQFEMTIPADPAAIPTITDGVTQLLHAKGWAELDVMAVELALQEAVANAIRHGCHNDPTKYVQCCVTFDDRGEILIVVRDPGGGFDPGAVPNPLAPANQLKSSGRGIFLINNLMDEVGFAAGGSELQMRKKKKAVS